MTRAIPRTLSLAAFLALPETDPAQEPEFLFGDALLPVLGGIELSLSVEQVFGWLRMG